MIILTFSCDIPDEDFEDCDVSPCPTTVPCPDDIEDTSDNYGRLDDTAVSPIEETEEETMAIGTLVKLNSNGPLMTIIAKADLEPVESWLCGWFDEKRELQKSNFPEDALTVTGPCD